MLVRTMKARPRIVQGILTLLFIGVIATWMVRPEADLGRGVVAGLRIGLGLLVLLMLLFRNRLSSASGTTAS